MSENLILLHKLYAEDVREDRIPILSIVCVHDQPWQSRNSVPPDISLMSWLSMSRIRRVSNTREGQEIWFYCTNCMLMMFGRTEFRFCQIVCVHDQPWQSRNSVPPDLSLRSWLSRNRRVSNTREGQEIWFYYTQTVCWWCSGGQNSDSVKNSVSSRSSLTESEFCPPEYFIAELIE